MQGSRDSDGGNSMDDDSKKIGRYIFLGIAAAFFVCVLAVMDSISSPNPNPSPGEQLRDKANEVQTQARNGTESWFKTYMPDAVMLTYAPLTGGAVSNAASGTAMRGEKKFSWVYFADGRMTSVSA